MSAILKSKRTGFLILLGIVVIGLLYFFFYNPVGIKLAHSNMRQLAVHLREIGWPGKIIGMALIFFQTFFPFIPFVVVAGTNVAIFGIKMGFLVNYVMSCLGAVASFYFARYYGHDWVEKKLEGFPLVTQFSKRMERHGFFYVLIGRLIPILPSSAINFSAGLTRMRFRHFLWGTLLGKFPIVFLESMIAHDLFHFQKYKGRLLVLLGILVLLLLLGNSVKRALATKAK
ncbi:TVP38/TMEM64 family protein [Paenibacillus roseipurpureus]|uniref:TVP38/TMEM64 family membrane protein n=1 Tax=Paenibacillus roseopurpureus TaxID=2918901 RepID=A0AA96LSN2_9BACL|nr:TVP38/TMEM64 family protein [Paenibacillus sp. MBLB1832]WNR46544.1 TVP38/TMEM64 family protein [Paenibacillus sp. MBLB1832]